MPSSLPSVKAYLTPTIDKALEQYRASHGLSRSTAIQVILEDYFGLAPESPAMVPLPTRIANLEAEMASLQTRLSKLEATQ